MNRVAIVQARVGSSRLRGKVLRVAAGKTFLEHLLERLSYCTSLDGIVVATSDTVQDEVVAALCRQIGLPCFRGSEADVLDRYYQAAVTFKVDVIVRITADCPLIDPDIVDYVVSYQTQNPDAYDLVTNRHPLTYPDGLDVDVMPFAALETAWRLAVAPNQREHVIPYFWEAGLRVANVTYTENLFQRYRWTVDYEEDAMLVGAIFEGLYVAGKVFKMQEIIDFLRRRPDLAKINARYLPDA